MGAGRGHVRSKCRGEILAGSAVLVALFTFLLCGLVKAEAPGTPSASPAEDALSAPLQESPENQPSSDEVEQRVKEEKVKLLMLLLLVTFILAGLVLVIFILAVRYGRYFFPLRKEVKPTKLEDVWWLADPKSGKPREKKEDPS